MSAHVHGPVYLWWIGEREENQPLMEALRREVEGLFGPPVAVCRQPARPSGTYDARRAQHSSTAILRWLSTARPADAHKTLAITDVDLFIPVLTYVFGEAQLDGPGATVSTARLAVDPGARAAPAVEQARLFKECIHELGHTFGLTHCDQPGCVMTRSTNLREVDAKRAALCRDCQDQLRERLARPKETP